jgi:hypothetical protein
MDGGGNAILLLEFFGIAGLTIALAVHQLYRIKQYEMKMRAKEEAVETAGTERPQAG